MRGTSTLSGMILLMVCAVGWADPLDPIPAETVAAIAPKLVEAADKLADPQFKIDADTDKATGLHKQDVGGLMVIPGKGLKADTLTGVQEANGAPVGYFFLYKLSPIVDAKPLQSGKLTTVTLKGDDGTERVVAVLRLAVKKESDTDWTLLVFAKDKKPILTAKLKEQANNSDLPISVAAKESGNDVGNLTITMFGKYAADVPLGRMP